MVRFCKCEAHFRAFHARLKFTSCLHCNRCGCLILNGRLYGYSDSDNQRIKRGHRIFCSNRNNKTGCGKTFCVLSAGFLPGHVITADSLWRFFKAVKKGFCLARAFSAAGCNMATTSIYRLFRKFTHNQAHIRSHLTRIKDPPRAGHRLRPVIQTILHLNHVFTRTPCPISEFQHHFQAPFF